MFLGNGLANTFPRSSRGTAGKRGVSARSVPRSYIEDNWGDQVSCVLESVKRGLERGDRGITVVGAVTRKRLVTH
jgi:hypothetical protein